MGYRPGDTILLVTGSDHGRAIFGFGLSHCRDTILTLLLAVFCITLSLVVTF